jgi:flagellar biosynthetic protein FlhB
LAEGNKTEQPTPRRRQKAREQGQVARSRDLVTSLATLTGITVLALEGGSFAGQWRQLLRRSLETAAGTVRTDFSLVLCLESGVFRATLMAIGLSWTLAVCSALAQGGLVFAPTALAPNFSRLSPGKRLEQLFSLPALGRLLKSVLPALALVYLTAAVIVRDWSALLSLPRLTAEGLTRFGMARGTEIAWKSGLILLAWSGADYLLEHQKLEGELRMSRQDVMDEFKETEGHPAVRARIRRLQRQVRRRRMLEEVKTASVVVTNPSEFAVALAYRPEMKAPTVVAKGRNLLARQIKELARWHNVPLIENPPLAHALYRAVEVGQSIPPKLYTVVAGVLAAIYRAQQRAQGRAQRSGVR